MWSQGEIDIVDVPTEDWSPHAIKHFINNLDADLSTGKLIELDTAIALFDGARGIYHPLTNASIESAFRRSSHRSTPTE